MHTTPEDVVQMLKIAQELEASSGDDDRSLGAFLQDEEESRPHGTALSKLRGEELRDALSRLSHRERRVLELHYGLDGSDARTFAEVARALGTTQERVRQIESRALAKLESAERGSPGGSSKQDAQPDDVLPDPITEESAGMFDCELEELVPNERIVLRWRFVSLSGMQTARDSRVTVSVRRASDDATRLVFVYEHSDQPSEAFPVAEFEESLMPGLGASLDRTWRQAFNRLAAAVSEPE